ncbi:MAG: ABC transporter substrate-binding protein [Caldilineaceae bacterium]|nr:ABC transporter substrate-binding protein [Caldilineaceae bacterium]
MSSRLSRPMAWAILALVMLALVACTQLVAPAPAPATEAPVEEPGASSFPLTVTDALSRTVTVASRPQRIVSTLPSNTEMLFAVGAGDQVVGVTKYCNYPPEAATRAQVGGITNKSLSVEAIIALEPDLVLAGAEQDQAIDALSNAGIPVVALRLLSFDEVYSAVELVGALTGHAESGTALAAAMRSHTESVQAAVGDIAESDRPTVFYEVWHEPLMTAGPGTFIGQMIEMAGGRSIFADVSEDWPQVSAEVVVERDPAVILGPDSHSDQLTAEAISARPGWSEIAAVKDNRIYLLDGDMVSRPGPRVVDALETIARALHPDRFQ